MLFSFIVPVYNTSKYLDKCIQSLLCQKGAKFEILLVDDGSTDNSGKMCDDYAKRYPDMVRVIHKENEGLLLTRRRGFQEAKGQWLICIDSDDFADEKLLEFVVNAIDTYSPDMVMYNYQYINDKGDISSSRLRMTDKTIYSGENKQSIYEKRLLTDDINNMWSKALKREIVDVDSDYCQCGIKNMCEDAIQVLPLFTSAQKIIYLDTPLYFYRKGQNSMTAARTYDNWMASKTCFLITEEYLSIWKMSDELIKKFYTRYTEVLSNFLRWCYAQPKESISKSFSDIIRDINKHPAFERCMRQYSKHYSSTMYLKITVPIIMKFVRDNNEKKLARFFILEKRIVK